MDLNRIATFVRVAEMGSFTAAAREMGAPKSSVSRAVSSLELDLGVRLLQRTTRKLHLTEAGRAYLERARTGLAALEEASAEAGEMGEEPRGHVRMTAPPGSEALPGILAAFTQRYPRVHVAVVFTGRYVNLVEEGFDLALRGGRLEDSTLVARKITEEKLALYASPTYLRRRGRPRRLADLAEHDCVLQRAVNGRATYRLHGANGEEHIEVRGPLSADEMLFLLQAAEAGAGIALLPDTLVRSRLARKSLVRVLPDYAAVGRGLFVVVPSSRFLPARVAALRDFLVEGFHAAGRAPSS